MFSLICAMSDLNLFSRALKHLVEVSGRIKPDADPGSAIKLEAAFMWNHSNNVAVLGLDFQLLLEAGSFSGPVVLARTMMESALFLSAGATNPSVMREKIDYDLRENYRRLKRAEKALETDLAKEKQILDAHLKAIRAGSGHNQNAELHFAEIAKRAKCDSTAAYRNYYFILSLHVHADWLAFIQAGTTGGHPVKAVRAAIFSCAVATEALLDFYPEMSNPTDARENRIIWKALVER